MIEKSQIECSLNLSLIERDRGFIRRLPGPVWGVKDVIKLMKIHKNFVFLRKYCFLKVNFKSKCRILVVFE